ncbi:hypothetical protein [Micromonospora sp. CA-246542]|uniref:hypothetical protein n=1 Tax=Micromonospora sp. CA-246542 TaxID=3239959 RepID=UPI003D89D3B0
MANTVNLEFAGDASKLAKASKDAERSVLGVGDSASNASQDMAKWSKETDDYTTRIGKLGSAVDGASTAIGDAAGTVQALADFQQAGARKAAALAQATNDMAQAQEDANQAMIDGKQATLDIGQAQIDAEQAVIDAATAQKDYNTAVRDHGKNSAEAKQAAVDLKQAQQDLKQANLDVTQAQADANQATIDGTQATLDLNEASKEAHPPDLQQWADQINMLTPLLTGMVGVVGLVTAAQWAWNIAQLASPTTWIVLGIVALIAVIVLIAAKTDWFQRAWSASWKWIKNAASDTWEWLKKIPGWIGTAFGKVAGFITAPFRAAFSFVADAWNNTVGRMSWTVPGWVPGIGGNSISAPHIPRFHGGGVVPGPVGQEQLAILQGGERVSTTRSGSGEEWIRVDLGELGDALLGPIARAVQRRGGSVTALGVRVVR